MVLAIRIKILIETLGGQGLRLVEVKLNVGSMILEQENTK